MGYVKNTSHAVLGQGDASELWEEIVSHIPDEILLKKNVRILNVACGHAEETKAIMRRMLALGRTKNDIKKAIVLNDKYSCFTNPWYNQGFEVVTGDFLEWETDMKFDVVIGNPPYLKRGWRKFFGLMVEKSSRMVLSINPDPSNNSSKFGKDFKSCLLSNGLQEKKECTEFFPTVNSGKISYFVLDKEQNAKDELFEATTLVERIVKKVLAHKDEEDGAFFLRGSQATIHGERSKKMTCEFSQAVLTAMNNDGLEIEYMSPNIIGQTKKHAHLYKGPFLVINRFFGKNNPDPVGRVSKIQDYSIGYNVIVFKLLPKETIDGFRSVYGSLVYRLVMNSMRQGGFDVNQTNLMALPRLDLTRTWTDEELYEHFGLTQEEIDYIEATVK